MVDAVAVADQSLGDAAEIEQAIPIGIVACHARDFQREHDADVAERNFRSHARKSRALGESGAGYTQVFVDDGHLLLGPTEFPCFLDQSMLARGGLAVVLDLIGRGLANVDKGSALGMGGLYFGQVIHDFPPG